MSTVTFSEARQQASSNYRAFTRMLHELLGEHYGQWVVLRDQIAIKVLPTEMDAYHYATREFPDERWSIQHIRDQSPIRMGSFSRAPITKGHSGAVRPVDGGSPHSGPVPSSSVRWRWRPCQKAIKVLHQEAIK